MAGSQGIEVDAADKFFTVRLLLTDDGLVAVLKEMAGSTVTQVVAGCIAREQSGHDGGQGSGAGPEEEVGVVRKEGPGIAGGGGLREEQSAARYEVPSIGDGGEDGAPLDTPDNDMMEDAGGVETGIAGE